MVDGIEAVRAFNRFYTLRIGALQDRYLGQRRTLAEARLIYEIGPRGTAVHDAPARLGLDSGYLSRLLRSLERAGLVETRTDAQDRRQHSVQPTAAGLAELAEMNRRADADAAKILDGLHPLEQQELLSAMATVERLVRGSARSSQRDVAVRPASPVDAVAIARLLATVFGDQRDHFTPEALAASTPSVAALRHRIAKDKVWVGERGDDIVGTVSSQPAQGSTMLIRSLAVLPRERGVQLGYRLLGEAERDALERGFEALELDTTPFQAAAGRLYHRFGFLPIRRHERYGTPMICLRKELGQARPRRTR